jgi:hypothetical protein
VGNGGILMAHRDIDDQVKRLQEMQKKLMLSSDSATILAVEQVLALAYIARELSNRH